MKTILHKAHSRGHANHGWLDSRHTFSFAGYFNPDRVGFGKLRVLNDDTVAPGMGFGKHRHENMEIISIPLAGDLEHKDSMGNTTVIHEGDVQVMSAGTGIYHSEFNRNKDKPVKFLQIWVYPREKNVAPRYDQAKISELTRMNEFSLIVSPNKEEPGVWIHQDAWFHIGEFQSGRESEYSLKMQTNGVYIFVLEGTVSVNGETLDTRDGMGIVETDSFTLRADTDASVLLMEIPMN